MIGSTPYENMEPERNCIIFTKCCFCIPLRIGCFILGYLSMFLNLLLTIFFVGSLTVMIIFTHGFKYMNQTQTANIVLQENAADKAKLHMIIMVILPIGCLNLVWLMLNGLLLIGLHKKKPGSIKVPVAVATLRIIVYTLSFVSVHTSKATIFCWIEICLSSYFIIIYYAHSLQMEREQRAKELQPTQDPKAAQIP